MVRAKVRQIDAEINGGHILLDLQQYWKPLIIKRWMDDHARYFWRHAKYNDEATWRLAISLLGTPYRNMPRYCAHGCIVPCHEDRRPAMVHRIRWHRKLFPGMISEPVPSLPCERRAFEVFAESYPVLKPRVDECFRSEIHSKTITYKPTKTQPCIFHAPGMGHEPVRQALWPQIRDYAADLSIVPCEELLVLTCNSTGQESPLEKQLAGNKQPHRILGVGLRGKRWQHSYKFDLYLAALQSTTKEIVMGLDALDVAYTDCLQKAVFLLRRSGKEIIFGAESVLWGGQFVKDVKWTTRLYLNAGCWIGYREPVIKFLEACKAKAAETHDVMEQPTVHWYYAQHQDAIGIDDDCEVFCCDLNDSVLAIENYSRAQYERAKRRAILRRRR